MAPLRPFDPHDRYQRVYLAPAPLLPPIATDAKPRRPKSKILPPVHPNAGVEAVYRRKLHDLIEEMNRSFIYKIKAAYRKNEPEMAQDELPATDLASVVARLARQWQDRFDEAADDLANYFSKTASRRSDAALQAILRKAGISVRFTMTREARDILRATIEQNIALIKSIPQQYHLQVQGEVMRSVQAGRDLGPLSKFIMEQYGITKRRAAFIARSQNNLATASMTHARQTELGIEEAIWQHSHGGREPRRTHLAKSGAKNNRYKISDGWYDPEAYKVRGGGFRGEWIYPGQLPNCRCVSRAIVKGFS